MSKPPDTLAQQIAALAAALQLPLPEESRRQLMTNLQALQATAAITGDAVAGDKVGGDKVGGNKVVDPQGTSNISGTLHGNAVGVNNGTVQAFFGTQPPADTKALLDVDSVAAQALLETLPLDTIPDLAPRPPSSRMPLSHNPLFVGRADDLAALAAVLKGGGTAAIGQVAATTGLSGIGKTNLATELAHRYGQYFAGGVCWLNFTGAAAVTVEVASCGGAGYLNLHPGFSNLTLDDGV